MIFHENCLPADDSHEISCLIFFPKFGKMLQNLPSAAVVIGALRVNQSAIYFSGNTASSMGVYTCLEEPLSLSYALFIPPLHSA